MSEPMGLGAIFIAGMLGYTYSPAWTMFASAFALIALTYARHYRLAQRGIQGGLDDIVQDTLLRTALNAVMATGGCYVFGYVLRTVSGL